LICVGINTLEINLQFDSSSDIGECVTFLLFLMGLCPKPQSLFALMQKVTKKIKKFPRQSAALTRRQRLKSVQGFHFS
jgi:hypothetical protein